MVLDRHDGHHALASPQCQQRVDVQPSCTGELVEHEVEPSPASLPPPPPAPVVPPTATPVVPVTPPAPPATPPLPPPTTVAACVESSENRTMSCPAGSVGQVFQSRRHHCGPDPSVYEAWAGATTAGPWTDTSNTCTPCPGPESRTVACPSGQLGSIGQQRTFVCSGMGSWNAWTSISNTCAQACVAPAPEWRPAPYKASCPAGWTGTGSNWTTGERRTWTCPSSTGSPTNTGWVWDGTPGVFVDNGDCLPSTPACALPTPSTQSEAETRTATQRLGCPAGQQGEIIRTRQEQRTRSRSAYCPTVTGSFAWNPWSTWSGWSAIGSWTTASNTCIPITGPSCSWVTDVYSLAPNFGNLDGETVSYDDGRGGGCNAAWGGRSGITDQSAFHACRSSIPTQPLSPGAYYSLSEYTNWGGGMENQFGYRTQCVSTGNYTVMSESCWSETNYALSSLDQQARALCAGASIGSGGTIHHFPDYQIGCYADIQCN